MDDVVGCHFDPKGKFLVRSAYKVHRASEARKSLRVRPGDTEGSNGKTDFWQKLWKLDCPPKIKHFLWRLSHNTLAVKNILKRRGMKIDTCCSLCQRLDEDGGHLFLRCKEVKGVWRELNLEAVRCRLLEVGSARQMMEMIHKLEAKTQLIVILLLWLWWDERNKLREEGRRRSALELAYIAAAMADKFKAKGAVQSIVGFSTGADLEQAAER